MNIFLGFDGELGEFNFPGDVEVPDKVVAFLVLKIENTLHHLVECRLDASEPVQEAASLTPCLIQVLFASFVHSPVPIIGYPSPLVPPSLTAYKTTVCPQELLTIYA